MGAIFILFLTLLVHHLLNVFGMLDSIRDNLDMYLKNLIIYMSFYFISPWVEVEKVIHIDQPRTIFEFLVDIGVVNGLISSIFAFINGFGIIYLTWRFDKWKKKQK